METLDRSRALRRERVPAGTALIVAGSIDSALTIIHSGLAELLEPAAAGSAAGSRGRRVGLIKGTSLCGISDLREPGPARRTIRTLTECIVSNVPSDAESIVSRLTADAELALSALRGLVQRVESAMHLFRNYKYLWHKLALMADAVALAYDFGPEILEPREVDRLEAPLSEYSAYVRGRLGAEGIELPAAWDPNVLVGRYQERLDLYRDEDRITAESVVDLPQFLFLKRLLARPDELVSQLISEDEPGTAWVYSRLGDSVEALISQNVRLVGAVERLLDRLFGDDGWIATALERHGGALEERLFLFYLSRASYRFHKDVMNLLGRRLERDYPLYRRLGDLRRGGDPRGAEASLDPDGSRPTRESAAGQELPGPGAASGVATGSPDPLAKYRGLTARLLEFSGLSQKEQFRFTSLLDELKAFDDPLSDETAARTLREKMGPLYWRLYESCFLKVINSDLKAFVPGIMLHFGLVDETLVSDDDLRALDAAYANALYTDDSIPVMTYPYFLEKVYRGSLQPSMTELGDTFAKRIKSQKHLSRRERDQSTIYDDTPEDRVRFELREVAGGAASILFGSRRRALPFLVGAAIQGSVRSTFLEPEEIARRVHAVRSRDFTIFYRDVGLRHAYGTDIVRKEVVPHVVLFPVVGSRMMMWQELDGTSRHTSGRLFLPGLFCERFDDALLTVLGHFRWELQKTIAGASWMDPVDGGLVGAYYDYINFYQKNPNLTPEARERVKQLVKKTRSDRDRFTIEYAEWIRYEFDGKIRLNPVARDIFYRFCPFPRTVREEMARRPLYGDLERKYQNRLRKSTLKLETRARRFEKHGEPLPEDLARTIALLEA